MKLLSQKSALFSLALSTVILLSGCAGANSSDSNAVTRDGFYFDTVISVTLYGDEDQKEEVFDGCFTLAEKYEKLFSTEIEGSDLWKINHSEGEPVAVDQETLSLIETGLHYGDVSEGRFSITVGSLSKLWDFSKNADTYLSALESGSSEEDAADDITLPSENDIKTALSSVNDEKIIIDHENCMIRLTDPDTQIDLGAVAKGYIADRMKEYLIDCGESRALINLGGNVLLLGTREDGKPFKVGIQKPFSMTGEMAAVITPSMNNETLCSVVTSGNYQRYFKKDGRIYHHILDLSTGYPAESGLSSVTIISESSVDGDALSTVCFLLGEEKARELLKNEYPGTEAIFIDEDGTLSYTEGLEGAVDVM